MLFDRINVRDDEPPINDPVKLSDTVAFNDFLA